MSRRVSAAPLLPVIGVTGPVGAGKSEVASLFGEWGGILVSGDVIGKYIVDNSPTLRGCLARAFGNDILRGKHVRRSLLAQRAFADAQAAARLNRIVHPSLISELNRRIRNAQRSRDRLAVVIDAALLPEWGRKRVPWDILIGVWAPLAIRKQRLRKRGWTERQILARSRCQMSWNARRAIVDCVVKNDADLSLLERRARLCWQKALLLGARGTR